ncbi:MAG: OmpP1/FadL family transporter [Rhodomicrobium sp.]
MLGGYNLQRTLLAGVTLLLGVAASGEALAGAFGIREQSTYFTGDAYAGAAAGGDISSMFWNPAATATLPGFNSSSSYTGIFGNANEHATGGVLEAAPGLPLLSYTPSSANAGSDALVPASYLTYQYNDRLYFGLALNSPFGLVTKPDSIPWAGSPIANTTKVLSFDANPTVAYMLTPTLTVGAGVQIEYFEIWLNHGDYILPGNNSSPQLVSPGRSYGAMDTSAGGTAGAIWQPVPGTSLGLGYRSAVSVNPSGSYLLSVPGGSISTNATAGLTLPDEVTFSVRQAINPQLTLLGTVEWDRWSSLGNVSATSGGCLLVVGSTTCETLNLNYNDGWFFSVGAEYAYTPLLTLRGGVGYEISPITDSTRDTLVPDSNRVHVNIGASYKWSEKITLLAAYSHIFFDNAPFCIANSQVTGSTHCTDLTPQSAVLLTGAADVSADIVSVGLNYKFGEPPAPLK